MAVYKKPSSRAKKSSSTRTATAGKKRTTKKSSAKKASSKKPSTKKKVISRPLPKKRITKKELFKENKRLQEELEKLRQAQENVVGKPKGSKERKTVEKQEKKFEKLRAKKNVILSGLPVKTPQQTLSSKELEWERMENRFDELMKVAAKTKQIPKSGRARKKINTKFNIGEEVISKIKMIVNPGTIEEIMYKVIQSTKKLSGQFPIWWANMVFSALGERLIGSKPRILELPGDPDARFFQTEGYDNTGIWNTLDGMLIRLEQLLDEYGSSARTIVYLHFVRVMNFDRKRV